MARVNFHAVRLSVLVAALALSDVRAGELRVVNDTESDAYVWLYPASLRRYEKPPLFVRAETGNLLPYRDGERYWIVAKNEHAQEAPVGWVNISEKVRANPDVMLRLAHVYKTNRVERWVFDRRLRRWRREVIEQPKAAFDAYLYNPTTEVE